MARCAPLDPFRPGVLRSPCRLPDQGQVRTLVEPGRLAGVLAPGLARAFCSRLCPCWSGLRVLLASLPSAGLTRALCWRLHPHWFDLDLNLDLDLDFDLDFDFLFLILMLILTLILVFGWWNGVEGFLTSLSLLVGGVRSGAPERSGASRPAAGRAWFDRGQQRTGGLDGRACRCARGARVSCGRCRRASSWWQGSGGRPAP